MSVHVPTTGNSLVKPTVRDNAERDQLCRPSEVVLEILENPDIGPFAKEDGEIVVFRGVERMA